MSHNSDLDKRYSDTDLTSNMEDYMEAIAMLSMTNRVVRVKDIARKLNIKMPSVTAALGKLREMNLIDYEKYGYIELTEEGKAIASRVFTRHATLTEFFHDLLQLPSPDAEDVACRVEHTLSPQACRQIHKLLEFVQSAEREKEPWTDGLKKYLAE